MKHWVKMDSNKIITAVVSIFLRGGNVHVILTKKKSITEKVFILTNKSVVNITNLRICLSLWIKEHWRRKWFINSISFRNIQISSRQSLKLCLTLLRLGFWGLSDAEGDQMVHPVYLLIDKCYLLEIWQKDSTL